MRTLSDKLYVQLAPTKVSRDFLCELAGKNTSDTAKKIEADTLHLTVLHIGLLEKLFRSLQAEVEISEADFLQNAKKLSEKLQLLAVAFQHEIVSLAAEKFDHFGPRGSVLVLRFSTDKKLLSLHEKSLVLLREFLKDCSVKNVDDFIQKNDSLQHSLTLRPHVSLARNFGGPLPDFSPCTLDFSLMKIVYEA